MVLLDGEVALRRGLAPGLLVPAVPASTHSERLLLALAAAFVPLETIVPSVFGLSFMWLVFAALTIYVLSCRPRQFIAVLSLKSFCMAYLFIAFASLMEAIHPYASFVSLLCFAEMLVAATIVATLARDRPAILAALRGYLLAAIGLSLLLAGTVYTDLAGSAASSFVDASIARSRTVGQNSLKANTNEMGFIIAQGAVIALALAIASRSRRVRITHGTIVALAVFGVFLSLSRGAVLVLGFSVFTVLLALRARRLRIVLLLAVGLIVFVRVAPEALFARLHYGTTVQGRLVDERAALTEATLQNVDEYMLTGVGAGRFERHWAQSHGFGDAKDVYGTHNIYSQIAINWGIMACGLFIIFFYLMARHRVGRTVGMDVYLAMAAIAATMVSHGLVTAVWEGKTYALGLGLVIGSGFWMSRSVVRRRV